MAEKQGYVHMMTNRGKGPLYTGVTSDLKKRVYEHKEKLAAGFTKKYNIDRLVYYEACDSIQGAIEKEKQIKAGSRAKKIELIKGVNPWFKDLYEGI